MSDDAEFRPMLSEAFNAYATGLERTLGNLVAAAERLNKRVEWLEAEVRHLRGYNQ